MKRDPRKSDNEAIQEIEALAEEYRQGVDECLRPLVYTFYPSMAHDESGEYPKMLELSTKMTLVGHACTEIAGYPFDARRQRISSLFGGCCFLADSFIDDFGDDVAWDYLERFELLLTRGWFDVTNERERLFYAIIARLFSERDVLAPMLRQAILWLYLAQTKDVELRQQVASAPRPLARGLLYRLRRCARDRGGHAITALARFVAPEIALGHSHAIFTSGALIVFIDDHGDCHSDRRHNRITYMNQLKHPARVLQRLYDRSIAELREGLPKSHGRDLMEAFLYRYFVTRLRKHELQKGTAISWAVYE